jgi:tetratricopeptide (TPR) repeat protein
VRAAILLVGLAWSTLAAAAPTPSRLLEGVRAFQARDYTAALADFEAVAQEPGAPPDLAFYLGPTLYKLGRYQDALAVFLAAPMRGDALANFYLGQTYYQLGLYRKARLTFMTLRARGLGPRLAAAAETYVALIDALYAVPPARAAIEAYRAEGQRLLDAGRPALAAEYAEEARLDETLTASP